MTAKEWTEKNFPGIHGAAKAMLIVAFGAGVDEGLRQAQEIAQELMQEIVRRSEP